jgi:deazaflavin-dependent oxidoreductase (nitroreductase family)
MDIQQTNRRVIEQFRAGGEIDGMHRERLVLLTTVGGLTGQQRTTPMMFHRDGDRILVVAANAGAPKHPDWYRNLSREPHVQVEIGDQAYPAIATVLAGAERDQEWTALKKAYPFFAEFEKTAGRTIPVVVLTRTPDSQ